MDLIDDVIARRHGRLGVMDDTREILVSYDEIGWLRFAREVLRRPERARSAPQRALASLAIGDVVTRWEQNAPRARDDSTPTTASRSRNASSNSRCSPKPPHE